MMGTDAEILLGVNVDHVATLRQARGTEYPDPVLAAKIAQQAGADGITVHLREDRRHIQDSDVLRLPGKVDLPLNLEMAATAELHAMALRLRPYECCLVPERRAELTTEGGLDVAANIEPLDDYCAALLEAGIRVSLFIDPDPVQIEAVAAIGVPIVELHTGRYADAVNPEQRVLELRRIEDAATRSIRAGLQVNAGHGLNYDNVQSVAGLTDLTCLNIGHAIIARAVFDGMAVAVSEMKHLMVKARQAKGGGNGCSR